jgi:hypothetical protein
MMNRVVVSVSLLAALTGIASAANGQWSPDLSKTFQIDAPHIYRFKTLDTLSYDTSLIAVQIAADTDASGVWAAAGIDPATAQYLPINGWHLVTMPAGQRTLEYVVTAVDVLSTMNGVSLASPVFLDEVGMPMFPTATILTQFNEGVDQTKANTLFASLGTGQVVKGAWNTLARSYKTPTLSRNGFDVLAQANALAERGDVRFAEPDMIYFAESHIIAAPDDEGFPNCWGLNNTGQTGGTPGMDMGCLDAWDIQQGNPNVYILIIDNGVQQDHPDINQVTGMDFTTEAPMNPDGGPVYGCDDHGTPVAGCATAPINSRGTVGTAPGCRSISARCYLSLDVPGCQTNVGATSWVSDALDWAMSNEDMSGNHLDVRVTCHSWSTPQSAPMEALYEMSRNGSEDFLSMIHFGSAGNSGEQMDPDYPAVGYPSRLPTINSIAALDHNGDLAVFSQWSEDLAFAAPGEGIYTTQLGGGYDFSDGTSFSAPYAAGVAALLMSEDMELTAIECEQILYASAVDLGDAGFDDHFGHGFVNALNALEMLNQGGCCVGDSCMVVNESDCGGTWLGSGTDCSNSPCNSTPGPDGACCLEGECSISTEPDCSGAWLGADTDCTDNNYCTPDTGYRLVPDQYATIQEAINASSDGDTILVEPGTHLGSGETVLKLYGTSVTIEGIAGADRTFIDGEDARRVVTCSSHEEGVLIKGFTITGGYSTTGAGVYCVDSSPVFTDCIMDSNVATSLGGGAYCYQNDINAVSPSFINCTFANNSAGNGGGLYSSDSNPSLVSCTVTGNTGGGIYNTAGGPVLSRTVLCQNSPAQLDGDYVDGGGNRMIDSCPGCSGDIDGGTDEQVDSDDLQWLISAWGSSDVLADIDDTGTVGVADLISLLSQWGACN